MVIEMGIIQSSPLNAPKKVIKRQSIIQAAIEVFSKNGFQNSSICEIAKRAGVAEGTIYQYFKNNEDLFFSIPVEKTKEFCRDLDLHLEGITGAYNKVRKFIWFYLYFFQSNPEYSRTLMLEMRVTKRFSKAKVSKSFKPFTNKILEIIDEGQKEGIIRQDVNIYLLRQLVLGLLEHTVTRWLLKGEKYDMIKYCGDMCSLVFNGIGLRNKLDGDLSDLTKGNQ
jgi:TetR/AcrR family transcriptional regulator, fatty acid metabolism regulator protein